MKRNPSGDQSREDDLPEDEAVGVSPPFPRYVPWDGSPPLEDELSAGVSPPLSRYVAWGGSPPLAAVSSPSGDPSNSSSLEEDLSPRGEDRDPWSSSSSEEDLSPRGDDRDPWSSSSSLKGELAGASSPPGEADDPLSSFSPLERRLVGVSSPSGEADASWSVSSPLYGEEAEDTPTSSIPLKLGDLNEYLALLGRSPVPISADPNTRIYYKKVDGLEVVRLADSMFEYPLSDQTPKKNLLEAFGGTPGSDDPMWVAGSSEGPSPVFRTRLERWNESYLVPRRRTSTLSPTSDLLSVIDSSASTTESPGSDLTTPDRSGDSTRTDNTTSPSSTESPNTDLTTSDRTPSPFSASTPPSNDSSASTTEAPNSAGVSPMERMRLAAPQSPGGKAIRAAFPQATTDVKLGHLREAFLAATTPDDMTHLEAVMIAGHRTWLVASTREIGWMSRGIVIRALINSNRVPPADLPWEDLYAAIIEFGRMDLTDPRRKKMYQIIMLRLWGYIRMLLRPEIKENEALPSFFKIYRTHEAVVLATDPEEKAMLAKRWEEEITGMKTCKAGCPFEPVIQCETCKEVYCTYHMAQDGCGSLWTTLKRPP